jgi:hypothetical protein
VRRLIHACFWQGALRRTIGIGVLADDLVRIEAAGRMLRRARTATRPIPLRLLPDLATLELHDPSDGPDHPAIKARVDGEQWNAFERNVLDKCSLTLVWEQAAVQPIRYTFEALMTIARHDAPTVLKYLGSLFADCPVMCAQATRPIGDPADANGMAALAKPCANRPAA